MGTAEVKAPILVAMRSIRRGLTTSWALCYVLERPMSLDSQDSPQTEVVCFPLIWQERSREVWDFVHSSVRGGDGMWSQTDWFHGWHMEPVDIGLLASTHRGVGVWPEEGARGLWGGSLFPRALLHVHDQWGPWHWGLGLTPRPAHPAPRLWAL